MVTLMQFWFPKVALSLCRWALLSLIALSIVSCGDAESDFKTKISMAAVDDVISENEIDDLKEFLEEYPHENLEPLYLSDSALFNYITKFVDSDVKVELQIEEESAEIGNINFFIETSASMGGYLYGGTEFQQTVNYLIADLSGGFKTIGYTIEKGINEHADIDTYRDDLTESRFKIKGHSPLHKAFDTILHSTSHDEVNFFATDGIISGADLDIRRNEEYNKEHANDLLVYTKRVFEQHPNIGISVYAFRSEFNGSQKTPYFLYDNTRVNKVFPSRPFYIFVFGPKNLMPQIKEYIKGLRRVDPVEELHFGFGSETIRKYSLFKSHKVETIGNCMFVNKDIQINNEPTTADPVHFAIAMNLSSLPEFAQDTSYLNKNIQFLPNNNIRYTNGRIKAIDDNLLKDLDHIKERPEIIQNGCTHHVDIYVETVYDEDVIKLKLPRHTDNWYKKWSCNDDSDIASNSRTAMQTFNLEYLIEGMQDAYDEDPFIDISIKIIND